MLFPGNAATPRMFVSPDLFTNNESINLDWQVRRLSRNPTQQLAAATFSLATRECGGSLALAVLTCAQSALKFAIHSSDCRLWLFVADRIWVEDTRLVRRRGLWGTERELLTMPGIVRIGSAASMVCDKRIRFMGALQIDSAALPSVVERVRKDPASCLLVTTDDTLLAADHVRELMDFAFPVEDGEPSCDLNWTALACGVCGTTECLLRVSGCFDDPEAAVDVISTGSRMSDLVSRFQTEKDC